MATAHSRHTVAEALRLRDAEGHGARRVADRLGLRWTAAFAEDETKAVTIYVSRKADVARMDEFIGPKS